MNVISISGENGTIQAAGARLQAVSRNERGRVRRGLAAVVEKGLRFLFSLNRIVPVAVAFASILASKTYAGEVASLARICRSDNTSNWVSVGGFCHILLLYGLGPTDLPGLPTGRTALLTLTDESRAIGAFGNSPLVRTRNGLRYCLADDPILHRRVGESHRDLCLSVFASLGLPLDTPIQLKHGRCKIADLLSDSVANFTLQEREPAWTAMSFAKYLPPQREWINRFGERSSFSELAEMLMRFDLNSQSCAGTHIVQALVEFDRADRRYQILNHQTRTQLDLYLANVVRELTQRQEPDGGWSKCWCSKIVNDDPGGATPFQFRVLVTGHLKACVLDDLDPRWRPSTIVCDRADDWLRQALGSAQIGADSTWVCPFTHAAEGLRHDLAGGLANVGKQQILHAARNGEERNETKPGQSKQRESEKL